MTGILRETGGEGGSIVAVETASQSIVSAFTGHSTIDLVPTRESLLSRLKGTSADESWREFFDTYWRLIYHNATKAGLSDEDAQEVAQETMIALTKNISECRYNPAHCSFKTWLMNLTRWKILDRLRLNQKVRKEQQPFRDQIEQKIEKA